MGSLPQVFRDLGEIDSIFSLSMKAVFVLLLSTLVSGAVVDSTDEGPSGCCDWPSCYDERVGLFLMTCYSQYMSPFGELPLQCYPDAAPHLQEAEELGLKGTPQEIREELHKLNAKNCHPKTGICRPLVS